MSAEVAMPTLGIDPAVIPGFALAMVLIELTPGPNLGYLALLGVTRGRGAGLWAVAGVTTGLAVWLLVALFGLTSTPLHSTLGLAILRWAGAVYLVWLAYDALRAPADGAADLSAGRPFLRGLAANLLNPKAAIFYFALLPGFISPSAGPIFGQILLLGGLHILISVLVHSAAVFGGVAIARLSPPWATGFRVLLAAGLVGAALWMALGHLFQGVSA